MFSQMLFATDPDPDTGEASGVGKYASSASSAIGKGVEKARPILAKVGSALLAGLRRLAELAMKGTSSSIAAVKNRSSKRGETSPPEPPSSPGEPMDEA